MNENNKWLRLARDGQGNITVVQNDLIAPIIHRLDHYFGLHQHIACVTSGVRTSEHQLRLIRKFCMDNGIASIFPEILTCRLYDRYDEYDEIEIDTTKIINMGGLTLYIAHAIYKWQYAWSKLLNLGIIINPPLPAICLFDYWKNGVNKKGQAIPQTPHTRGAIDIGGSAGLDKTPADELEIVSEAMADDPNLGIRSILLERNNNCLHINPK